MTVLPCAFADLLEDSPQLRATFALIGEDDRRTLVRFVESASGDDVRRRRAALAAMTLARYPGVR